jgi:hypothetical protein
MWTVRLQVVDEVTPESAGADTDPGDFRSLMPD